MKPHCIAYSHMTKDVEFVESQEEWRGKWDKDVIWYDIEWHESLKLIPLNKLRVAVNLAMTTWDLEIPVKYKPVWMAREHHEPDITIRFDNRENDDYFRNAKSVLAYAYLPGQGSVSGKIVFCADFIWTTDGGHIKGSDAIEKGVLERAYPDSKYKTYNVTHVLIHELGHSLGLRHDTDNNSTDVMDPYYKGTTLDLSPRDIYRIRLKYGVRVFKQWSHYAILKRWLKNRIRR